MTVTVFGIRNCDTMKKTFAWLDARDVAYDFHDYKKLGAPRAALERWCDAAGWEAVLNRAGTTFRKLPDAAKTGLDRDRAIALMLESPSLIKRPVLETGGAPEFGFEPERWARLLGV
ncbi:Protein YffB [uncultured Alphaproteobacteria bacterium]|uniref:Protein YffB n=1 Tax=uncultured Alphaproteobacteria bacterium TaxID=91750 RepID=A0A212JR66_9PROT|nr:Protein YffB [uncultured Alphaproteobacteria bacterium]